MKITTKRMVTLLAVLVSAASLMAADSTSRLSMNAPLGHYRWPDGRVGRVLQRTTTTYPQQWQPEVPVEAAEPAPSALHARTSVYDLEQPVYDFSELSGLWGSVPPGEAPWCRHAGGPVTMDDPVREGVTGLTDGSGMTVMFAGLPQDEAAQRRARDAEVRRVLHPDHVGLYEEILRRAADPPQAERRRSALAVSMDDLPRPDFRLLEEEELQQMHNERNALLQEERRSALAAELRRVGQIHNQRHDQIPTPTASQQDVEEEFFDDGGMGRRDVTPRASQPEEEEESYDNRAMGGY